MAVWRGGSAYDKNDNALLVARPNKHACLHRSRAALKFQSHEHKAHILRSYQDQEKVNSPHCPRIQHFQQARALVRWVTGCPCPGTSSSADRATALELQVSLKTTAIQRAQNNSDQTNVLKLQMFRAILSLFEAYLVVIINCFSQVSSFRLLQREQFVVEHRLNAKTETNGQV